MKKTEYRPPKIAAWFLEKIIDLRTGYSAMGDFEEQFNFSVKEKGLLYARFHYRMQVIILLPSFFINTIYGSIYMSKNYLLIAFRNLKKHKSYSLINITGLATGFTCCLIILLFVQHELSFDKFHEKSDRIYRMSARYWRAEKWEPYGTNAWRTGELLREYFGEIEELVRMRPLSRMVRYEDKRNLETRFTSVDENFFEVFSFNLIKGDKKTVLSEPYTVVINEDIALKYFRNEDPIGKNI